MITAHSALRRSRSAGLGAACGIGVGTAMWSIGSLLGLGLLLQNASWLYGAIKFCGAAYLIFIGVRMIANREGGSADLDSASGLSDAASAGGLSSWQAFRSGLLTDLANPKAAAFFTSLFAVSVPVNAPMWFYAWMIVSVTAVAMIWYGGVALAISIAQVSRGRAAGERGGRGGVCDHGRALGDRRVARRGSHLCFCLDIGTWHLGRLGAR